MFWSTFPNRRKHEIKERRRRYALNNFNEKFSRRKMCYVSVKGQGNHLQKKHENNETSIVFRCY